MEMLHVVLGKAQRNIWFSLYQRAESSAVVLDENGADVGIKCSTFWKENSFQSKQGAANFLQETAEAALDIRRVKGAGGVGGGRSDPQGGEKRFNFPPDPSVPEHQSHLTPPAFSDLG